MKTIDAKRIYSDPACPKCRGIGMYSPAMPDCEVCKGTGWDEDYPCECLEGPQRHCECHKQQKIRVMTSKARIPSKNIPCTVRGYKPETVLEKANRQTVIKWLENYPQPEGRPGFFFYGAPGTGKTHMATAICNALIRVKGVQPLYASATEMMARATARIKDDSIPDPFAYPAEIEVLVLDDLGAEKPGEWAITLFAELLDYRYRNGMPTIVTSNLTIDGIEELYGPRIADRFHETCEILHFDGASRRRVAA